MLTNLEHKPSAYKYLGAQAKTDSPEKAAGLKWNDASPSPRAGFLITLN